MTSRAQRRRERTARVAPTARPARTRLPGVPALPLIAAGAGAALLAVAWTTTWAPGPGEDPDAQNGFTLEIPEPQQAAITSWERFFICYDLLDPVIIDLTLRGAQRAQGSLEFPTGGRVQVVLPAPEGAEDAAAGRAAAGEDELIAARQAILGAAVPGRMAQIRQQCGGGGGAAAG